MFKKIVKLLILIVVHTTSQFMASNSWAATSEKEILLKETNVRILYLLRNSNEAAAFLREDLTDVLKTLENAKIQWSENIDEKPFLIHEEGVNTIYLSKHFSFVGPYENTLSTVLNILFSLKRQLEMSRMPHPTLRIELFAKKFSPILFSEESSCGLSLYPLSFPLKSTQREKLYKQLLSLLSKKGIGFSSKWADLIMWIDLKRSSDLGCWGNNRNIIELTVNSINVHNQKKNTHTIVKQTACGYDTPNMDVAINKALKNLKHNFPACFTAGSN